MGRLLVAFAIAAMLIAGCGDENGQDGPSDARSSSKALSQMEVAFEGNPRQDEIQADLDEAFRLYGLPPTEQNYSRAGSSLVALRKSTGVPEMQILSHAIRLHVPDVEIKLPQAFGLAAADLATMEGDG